MPYPNEHAAPQRSPDGFQRLRRGRPEGFPEGISAIFGTRSDGSSDIQSIRADRDAFSPAEFRRWLESSGYKTEIEEARSVTDEDREDLAEWSAAEINKLPDSAFLYISPGGEKDEEGKTTPRALRHFPYRSADGDIDLPHLRNAISRIPQSKAPGLDAEKARKLQEKARGMLRKEDAEDLEEDDDKPFGGKKAPPFKAEGLQDDDADEDEDEDDEKKKKKNKHRGQSTQWAPGAPLKGGKKGTSGGMGNPASRRYYDDGFWAPPRRVALSGADTRTWVEVVRSGTFYGSTGPTPRRVILTAEDVGSMASSFETIRSEGWFNGGPPVGVNHASAFGSRDAESTKAMARIEDVETRPNGDGSISLWGLFSWTDEGARRVRSGEFSAISAELIPPASSTSKLTGEPMGSWALVGATLTNSPMIPGMRPPSVSVTVAATDDHPTRVALSEGRRPTRKREPTMSDNLLLKLAEATGLSSDHSALIGEIRVLQAEAAKAETLTEALEIATSEVEGLRGRNEHLEDREKTRVLDEACALGRIAPTERETYWKMVDTLGEDETHRVMTEGRIPVGRSSDDAPTDSASGGSAEDAYLALIDKAIASGMDPQQAWDVARATGADALYPADTEN